MQDIGESIDNNVMTCIEESEMKKLIATVFLLALPIILLSCGMSPPSAKDMESFVNENWNDISLVNEYLLGLGDRNAIISDDDGSILIALVDQSIEDDAVRGAIRALWKSGCIGITKYNEDNAITYTIWKRTFDEADCGIVYAIDHTLRPEVQFQTELVPLSGEGWYYYLAEYNKWRSEH